MIEITRLLALPISALSIWVTSVWPANANDEGILRIGGSTTLLPVISKNATDFMASFPNWSEADATLPRSKTKIFVSGGGSGSGIRSVIDGTNQIGLASRNLKDKEKKLLGEHEAILVGKDAVVIAAHKDSVLAGSLENMTKSQLAKIFSGEAKYAKDVVSALPSEPIVLYVRDSGAGSAEMFQKLIMKNLRVAPDALQVSSQGALLNRLESNRHAIGYLSSGLAFGSKTLKVFALNGVVPTNQRVISGEYEFTRPLLMITKGKGTALANRFIQYVLSAKGQGVLAKHNYVPVRDLGNKGS